MKINRFVLALLFLFIVPAAIKAQTIKGIVMDENGQTLAYSNVTDKATSRGVTTDANGLAYFDLNTMVTSTTPTTYYFEAFVQNGTGYTLKSVSHPTYNIAKGQMITSSIIVN